jgi:transcription initiation factor IIE alpha subunit
MEPEHKSMTTLKSIQPSPEHTKILQMIDVSGDQGVYGKQIAEALSIPLEKIQMHLRNMVQKHKIVGMVTRGSAKLYVTPRHVDAYRIANGVPNLPPRTTTVTAIVRAQARNQHISPERLKLEQTLLDATEPMRPEALALAAGLELVQVRRMLQSLRHEGFAANVAGAKNALWRACVHTKAAQATAESKSAHRVCNSTMPTMRQGLCMQPARAGALDHLQIKSRRGDQLVPAMPPMLIGSGIGGGMR